MRSKDQEALAEYIRDCADALELRDWTTLLTVGEPERPRGRADDKQWQATSESTPGRKLVVITMAPDCRQWRRKALRSTVAHELIHAHFANLTEMTRHDLYPHLRQDVYELFDSNFTRWLEYGIDAMADVAAKQLPLIQWPKKRR